MSNVSLGISLFCCITKNVWTYNHTFWQKEHVSIRSSKLVDYVVLSGLQTNFRSPEGRMDLFENRKLAAFLSSRSSPAVELIWTRLNRQILQCFILQMRPFSSKTKLPQRERERGSFVFVARCSPVVFIIFRLQQPSFWRWQLYDNVFAESEMAENCLSLIPCWYGNICDAIRIV